MRALVVALLLSVAACGAVPGHGSPPLPSPPTGALARWNDFPAAAHPRPIIIFDRSLEQIGQAGFTSEPDRKIDWGCNKFGFAAGVTLGTAAAPATAGGATHPGISAARAYSELMAVRAPLAASNSGCATSRPFLIKDVRWGTAGFPTDRGTMQMSAWIFDIAEIEADLAYSALDPSSFWSGGVTSPVGGGARLTADDMTLKIAVGNAGTGKCDSTYTASIAESSAAVAVAITRTPNASPDEHVICPLSLRIGYISVALKAPLGGRVVVDEKGDVMAVCPETGDC